VPLSNPQKTICESAVQNRFVISVTGRRFGKTHVAMRELARAASKPDQQVWYVAPSYRMAKGIVWDQLKGRLKELRWIDQSNEAELKLRLKNGSVIHLKGADNPDSLRGVGLDFIVLDEFQDIDKRTWTEVLRPTLSDKGGRAMFLGTPRGVGSFSHEMFTMAQSTDNWAAHTYTTLDGGNVPEAEIEEAKRDMDQKTFEQEYLATFNTYSGVVYYNFDRNVTVQPCTGKDVAEIHCGIDFNVDPMSVCISVIENNVIYFIDEIVMNGSNTDEVCDEIKRRYPKSRIIMYPDPAGKQRKTSAGGRTDISILQNAGFRVNVRNSHTPIRDRVNAVNAKLQNAKGISTLFVDPKCKQVINSLERLVYKPGTSIIEKDGTHDHMADAVGYLVDFLYPLKTEYNHVEPERWAFSGNNNARSWN
jgi:phage terminase large subunit